MQHFPNADTLRHVLDACKIVQHYARVFERMQQSMI